MYITNDLWNEIKSYLFHDINKHGKHLKTNNLFIRKYNKVIKSIPTISQPRYGPKIIFNSITKSVRIARYLYHNIQLRITRMNPLFNTIIETVILENFKENESDLDSSCEESEYELKSNAIIYYYDNIDNVKSKIKDF